MPFKISLFAFLLLLPGCWDEGGLLDNEYPGQVLATISGTLTNPEHVQVSDPVSIAIWWYNANNNPTTELSGVEQEILDQWFSEISDGFFIPFDPPPWELPCDGLPWDGTLQSVYASQRFISQNVVYLANFPIQFEALLFQLPPVSCMCDMQEYGLEGAVAIGGVIAYLDENGNDQYDFGTAQNAPERALASSEAPTNPWDGFSLLKLAYFDPKMQSQAQACSGDWLQFLADPSSLEEGFSILEIRYDLEQDFVESIVHPVETPVDLEMGELDQGRFCNEYVEQIRWHDERPPDPFLIWCDDEPHGRTYLQMDWPENDNPCIDGYEVWGGCLAEGMPTPDDWPCP